jgi:hypothetical protein
MTAICKVCGQVVTGVRLATVEKFATTDGEITERDVQQFDALGAAFNQHIALHHPKHATELAAVANLSTKVYAMRQALSSAEKFEALRTVWSDAIKLAIFGAPIQAAAEGAPSPDCSSSMSPPSGS